MRLFDWLVPRRRCVVLGCVERPNRQSNLCVAHSRELNTKIKGVVDKVRVTPPRVSRYQCTCGFALCGEPLEAFIRLCDDIGEPLPSHISCGCGGVAVRRSS